MATLESTLISDTYPLLLKIDSSGIDTNLRKVEDGDATDSALYISTTAIAVDATDKFYFDGDAGTPHTYIQQSTDDVLDIYVGGANIIKITESTTDVVTITGNLTVGEDDTGHDVTFYGATSASFMRWDESDDALILTDSSPIRIGDDAAGDMTLYHDGSHSYITNKTGTLKLATETSGIAVTIGHTTSETTIGDNLAVTGDLAVTGTSTLGGNIDFNSGTIDLSTQTVDVTLNAAVDALNFDSNTLSIDASNNRVGIGTNAPRGALEIVTTGAGTGAATDDQLLIRDDENSDGVMHLKLGVNTSDEYSYIQSTKDGTGNHDLVLNALGGNVGIGTDAPGYLFEVTKTGDTGHHIHFDNSETNNTGVAGNYGPEITAGATDGSGLTYYLRCNRADGNAVGYLQHAADGDFEHADNSDIRLKENVVDTAVKGLESVNAIKVRDFNWKEKGKAFKSAGLIANELREVFPSAVFGEPDAMEDIKDENGNITGQRILPMSLSKVKLVPVLIKAIQELSAKVTALESA